MTDRPERDDQFWAYVDACLDGDMTYSEAINMAEWDLFEREAEDVAEAQLTVTNGDPLHPERRAA